MSTHTVGTFTKRDMSELHGNQECISQHTIDASERTYLSITEYPANNLHYRISKTVNRRREPLTFQFSASRTRQKIPTEHYNSI